MQSSNKSEAYRYYGPEEENSGRKTENITIFESPEQILRLLIDDVVPANDIENLERYIDIDAIVQDYCRKQINAVSDGLIIYIPDRGILPPSLDAEDNPLTAGAIFQFMKALKVIRAKIRAVLEKNGARVLELKQTVRATRNTSLYGTGYNTALNGDDDGKGYKVNFYSPHEHSPFPEMELDHPSLMAEKVIPLKDEVLSIAPYRENPSSLHNLNTGFGSNKTLKSAMVLKAMDGCIYLHQKSIIHGDIKPGNILIFSEEHKHTGRKFAVTKLIDLEGVRKIGEDDLGTTHTPVFSEDYYYIRRSENGEKILWPHDTKKDIFSWGITLLEIAVGKSISKVGGDLDDILHACVLTNSDEEKEEILCKYIDATEIPQPLKILIKWMVDKSRDERPELEVVWTHFYEIAHTYYDLR